MVYNWCRTCPEDIKEKYDPGLYNSSVKTVRAVKRSPLTDLGAPIIGNILQNAKKMKIFLCTSPLPHPLSRATQFSPSVVRAGLRHELAEYKSHYTELFQGKREEFLMTRGTFSTETLLF